VHMYRDFDRQLVGVDVSPRGRSPPATTSLLNPPANAPVRPRASIRGHQSGRLLTISSLAIVTGLSGSCEGGGAPENSAYIASLEDRMQVSFRARERYLGHPNAASIKMQGAAFRGNHQLFLAVMAKLHEFGALFVLGFEIIAGSCGILR
jgi:hypothetical protein